MQRQDGVCLHAGLVALVGALPVAGHGQSAPGGHDALLHAPRGWVVCGLPGVIPAQPGQLLATQDAQRMGLRLEASAGVTEAVY